MLVFHIGFFAVNYDSQLDPIARILDGWLSQHCLDTQIILQVHMIHDTLC